MKMKLSIILDHSILYQFNFKLDRYDIENEENEFKFDIELKSLDNNLIIQIPVILDSMIESKIEDSCGYTLILNKDISIDKLFSDINYLRMINILNHFSFCTEFYIDAKNDYF
jgi:hypothetical protein